MTDTPANLDERRGMAAQKSTELRRELREVQADQAASRDRQEEMERRLLAAPAATRAEAAAKARYLIQLFATTPDAQDPRRQNSSLARSKISRASLIEFQISGENRQTLSLFPERTRNAPKIVAPTSAWRCHHASVHGHQYATDGMTALFVEGGVFLPKPYNGQRLVEAVRGGSGGGCSPDRDRT